MGRVERPSEEQAGEEGPREGASACKGPGESGQDNGGLGSDRSEAARGGEGAGPDQGPCWPPEELCWDPREALGRGGQGPIRLPPDPSGCCECGLRREQGAERRLARGSGRGRGLGCRDESEEGSHMGPGRTGQGHGRPSADSTEAVRAQPSPYARVAALPPGVPCRGGPAMGAAGRARPPPAGATARASTWVSVWGSAPCHSLTYNQGASVSPSVKRVDSLDSPPRADAKPGPGAQAA